MVFKALKKRIFHGQVTIEFTVTMVFTFLLMVGLIRVFTWTGRELIGRRQAHERILIEPLPCEEAACPLRQIRPTFFGSTSINATVSSNMYGNN